jgi:hypothetical protein
MFFFNIDILFPHDLSLLRFKTKLFFAFLILARRISCPIDLTALYLKTIIIGDVDILRTSL